MTDEITIGASGPTPEEDVADGTYPVMLVSIGEPETVDTPGGITATWTFRRWTFRINQTGSPYDGRTLESGLSLATGERSNQFGYITALTGGVKPAVGQKFGFNDLIGRMALATVHHPKEGGFPKILSLGAMPAYMLQQQFAATTGAPVAPAAPAAAPVAAAPAATDDLPF